MIVHVYYFVRFMFFCMQLFALYSLTLCSVVFPLCKRQCDCAPCQCRRYSL